RTTHTRHLPSLPTRRSSDLFGQTASRADGSEPERRAQLRRRHGGNAHRPPVARAGSTPPDAELHQRDRVRLLHRPNGLPERETLDRKSTRLNSSHSQISYAV